MSYMYGLESSNKDFTDPESFGKNTFTTAFPVALARYMDAEKGLDMNYIRAILGNDGIPRTEQVMVPLSDLIGIEPKDAYFSLEDSFAGYDEYATNEANRSDVVVKDKQTGKEISAFEVKLVAVPTSATAGCSREEQACELVVRPPSVEQLCFSIASSLPRSERLVFSDIIVAALGNPIDYDWGNEAFMKAHRQNILDAADEISRQMIDKQAPFALMGEWRTLGQEPEFDDECFDAFFFSNVAFLQLFSNVVRNSILRNKPLGRPERSLIWFIKSMFDYAAQGTVTFERTHSLVAFGGQSDKAGSFTSNSIRPFVISENFIHPRVMSEEYSRVIMPEGVAMLKPERRLDAVLMSLSLKEIVEKYNQLLSGQYTLPI